MAPNNTLLDDGALRDSIRAFDPKMVVTTTKDFGEGEIVVHHDLNRQKETKLLLEFLDQATHDGSIVAGKVTITSLSKQVWGLDDHDGLLQRMRGKFNPASEINKSLENGTIFAVNTDGIIENRNRHSEALQMIQKGADRFQEQMTKKNEREVKPFESAMKKARKLAPQHVDELEQLAASAVENAMTRMAQRQISLTGDDQ
jgi:hypothetical protein